MRIVQKQGGYSVLELNVGDVTAERGGEPSGAGRGRAELARVEADKFADGVWYCVAFRIRTASGVQGLQRHRRSSVTEGRALANIAEAKRLLPDKPVATMSTPPPLRSLGGSPRVRG